MSKKSDAAALLRAAADDIEKFGWKAGHPGFDRYLGMKSPRCALVAIGWAARCRGISEVSIYAARRLVANAIHRTATSSSDEHRAILYWNDSPGRTQEEVLALLRHVAQQASAQQGELLEKEADHG